MRSSLRDKALTGVRWSAIQNWGSKLAGFVVFLILAAYDLGALRMNGEFGAALSHRRPERIE